MFPFVRSSTDDDDFEWSEDDDDDAFEWTAIAQNYGQQLKHNYARRRRRNVDNDSDSDTPTIGASDADAESDTETEDVAGEAGACVSSLQVHT